MPYNVAENSKEFAGVLPDVLALEIAVQTTCTTGETPLRTRCLNDAHPLAIE